MCHYFQSWDWNSLLKDKKVKDISKLLKKLWWRKIYVRKSQGRQQSSHEMTQTLINSCYRPM
jgi:hypothetical protein